MSDTEHRKRLLKLLEEDSDDDDWGRDDAEARPVFSSPPKWCLNDTGNADSKSVANSRSVTHVTVSQDESNQIKEGVSTVAADIARRGGSQAEVNIDPIELEHRGTLTVGTSRLSQVQCMH